MRRRPAALLLAALPLAQAAACDAGGSGPDVLRVTRFKQAGQEGVLLNEPLVVHFDARLDPTSVTARSVRVVGPDGRAVPVELEVDRNRLQVLPQLPRRPDLADGSLAPGKAHRLELRGFPRPDGLRSRAGAPLAAPFAGRFETARPGPDSSPFVDPTPGVALPLTLLAREVGRKDPIPLACDEPLDPRSLRVEDFGLWRLRTGVDGSEALERVPLRASLARNDRSGARIELVPVAAGEAAGPATLAEGDYRLIVAPDATLADLGGNRVRPAWAGVAPPAAEVHVREEEALGGRGRLALHFVDPRRRSPEAPLGAAGTAWWSDTGVVTVRLPAVAGDGAHGRVDLDALAGGATPRRVAATELALPGDARVELPAEGLVVLRAQGGVRIDGTLARRSRSPERTWREDESPSDWLRRLRLSGAAGVAPTVGFEPGERASAWLARAEAEDPAWTVIVAGGDLSIPGELRSDGPVVLIAGGWVRVGGRVSGSEVWISEGGGVANVVPPARVAPLELDPPSVNPLREAQTWRVLSAPLGPGSGPVAWRGARVVGERGGGAYRVRFLGERSAGGGAAERVGPVDDPYELGRCAALRLVIELDLPAADPAAPAPWDPPRVDAVELAWDEAEDPSDP